VDLPVGPSEELPPYLRVELLERRLQRDTEVLGHVVELSGVVGPVVAPRLEDVFERLRGVLYHEVPADLLCLADPLALGAGPVWAVERERACLDRADVDTTVCAGELLGELDDPPVSVGPVARGGCVVLLPGGIAPGEVAGRARPPPADIQLRRRVREADLQHTVGLRKRCLDGVGDPGALRG